MIGSTHYPDYQTIEDVYPYSLEVPEIITKLCREITRNATLLIRLMRLMLDEGPPFTDSDYHINRVARRLENLYKIWDSYYYAERDEYILVCSELEETIIWRDSLQVKRRLGDLDEQDYMLRLSVAEWSIRELSTQKKVLKSNLENMERHRVLTNSGDVNYLYRLSMNSYQLISSFNIQPETMKNLLKSLDRIMETINSMNKSTI